MAAQKLADKPAHNTAQRAAHRTPQTAPRQPNRILNQELNLKPAELGQPPVAASPATSRLAAPTCFDDLLLYRLSRLVSVGGARVIRLCEGRFGISRREWRLIGLLAQAPDGLLSSALADRAHLDRARTSRAITSLVAKGLLQRSDRPGDARLVAVQLTDAGRAVHENLFPLVQAINEELLAELSPAAVTTLDNSLDHLQARAEALSVLPDDLPRANRRRGRR